MPGYRALFNFGRRRGASNLRQRVHIVTVLTTWSVALTKSFYKDKISARVVSSSFLRLLWNHHPDFGCCLMSYYPCNILLLSMRSIFCQHTHHITVLVKLEGTLDHAFKLCLNCGGREQFRKSSMVFRGCRQRNSDLIVIVGKQHVILRRITRITLSLVFSARYFSFCEVND